MKKLGLLIAGTFILASCDSSLGRNTSIMPVVHEGVAEEMDHHGGEHAHENHAEASHDGDAHEAEAKDSASVQAVHAEEKKDSAH